MWSKAGRGKFGNLPPPSLNTCFTLLVFLILAKVGGRERVKEPGENYREQTNLFLNPGFLIFRLPESGLASYLKGDASPRQMLSDSPCLKINTRVLKPSSSWKRHQRRGLIKENSTGPFRQDINIHALENAKPLAINSSQDHNHFKLSHEYIVMAWMKTVLYHDYTVKIFIQHKISAYGGWCVAELDEHANLLREMWPQQLLLQPWRRSEKTKHGLRLDRPPKIV